MHSNVFKNVRRILFVILLANLSVALLKLIFGYIIKSSSLTADGLHSLTDGSSNIIGLIGIYFASKPMDKEHPYGHKKFETIAGLFIAGMLLFLAGKIIYGAILRFTNPVVPEISLESLGILVVTLGINIFVARYEFLQGKKLSSEILISDSVHTKSDIYISIGVLATLIAMKLGLPTVLDPLVSLVVSGFILHAFYEIFVSTSGVLLDRAVVDAEKIREITMSFCQVKGCHKVRSRGREDEVFVDMHILTEPDMSVQQSHELTHEIEKKLSEEFSRNIQVFSHIEPYYENFLSTKKSP